MQHLSQCQALDKLTITERVSEVHMLYFVEGSYILPGLVADETDGTNAALPCPGF